VTRKERLLAAKNFALYYGQRKEKELSRFDVAIVEPLGQTPDSLKTMQEAGTLVLGYLSVMEINIASPDVNLLQTEDLLAGPDGPLKNEEYGNWLVDLRSKRWERMLNHKVGSLFFAGYDGLFLDTIANVEMVTLPQDCRTELIVAAAGIIAMLRKSFSEHILIQNNGVERLCLMTSKLIDGICWENPPFGRTESAMWIKEVIKRLKWLREEEKKAVFLLLQKDYAEINDKRRWMAREVADKYDFLFYEALQGYTAGVNLSANIKSP